MNPTQLQAIGGQLVGGVMYLKNKEIGRYNNGQFYLDPGHEELIAQAQGEVNAAQAAKDAVAAAELAQVQAAAAATEAQRLAAVPATKTTKAKAVVVPDPTPPVVVEVPAPPTTDAGVDDLIAQLGEAIDKQ